MKDQKKIDFTFWNGDVLRFRQFWRGRNYQDAGLARTWLEFMKRSQQKLNALRGI